MLVFPAFVQYKETYGPNTVNTQAQLNVHETFMIASWNLYQSQFRFHFYLKISIALHILLALARIYIIFSVSFLICLCEEMQDRKKLNVLVL